MNTKTAGNIGLGFNQAFLLIIGAAASFHVAYSVPGCSILILGYLFCLYKLTALRSNRLAFYIGLLIGMLVYGPQLGFLWSIFGPAAIGLWFILAFWLGLFLLLARQATIHLPRLGAALLIPLLWIALEYFRSELYYLRFSWMNIGYAFSDSFLLPLTGLFGVYGIGFFLICMVTIIPLLEKRSAMIATLVAGTMLIGLPFLINRTNPKSIGTLSIAGVQMEFPSDTAAIDALNKLVTKHPDAQLLLLSEYTFDGPVPESVLAWCRDNQRYLIVGAKDPAPNDNFYDTAFVIGPTGDIIFRQVKSVPIQFFKDGLPATEQTLWNSPWGKIGICVCYDLSYTKVTDQLVRLGAQTIIVPTMDLISWGRHQHELHARIAPIRAAEYGVAVIRVASSGISQIVNNKGAVIATAPFPGEDVTLTGTVHVSESGSIPLDRVLAKFSVVVSALFICWITVQVFLKKKKSLEIAQPVPA